MLRNKTGSPLDHGCRLTSGREKTSRDILVDGRGQNIPEPRIDPKGPTEKGARLSAPSPEKLDADWSQFSRAGERRNMGLK